MRDMDRLTQIERLVRTTARTLSVAAFGITLAGFICNPRSSNRDYQQRLANILVAFGVTTALIALLLCGLNAGFGEAPSIKKQLWICILLDVASIVMAFC